MEFPFQLELSWRQVGALVMIGATYIIIIKFRDSGVFFTKHTTMVDIIVSLVVAMILSAIGIAPGLWLAGLSLREIMLFEDTKMYVHGPLTVGYALVLVACHQVIEFLAGSIRR